MLELILAGIALLMIILIFVLIYKAQGYLLAIIISAVLLAGVVYVYFHPDQIQNIADTIMNTIQSLIQKIPFLKQ